MFACSRTAGWSAHILEQKRLGPARSPVGALRRPRPAAASGRLMDLSQAAALADEYAKRRARARARDAPRRVGGRDRGVRARSATTGCGRSPTARSRSSASARSSSCSAAGSRTRARRCAGSALIALEGLSRAHPGDVNAYRPLLHELAARDPNVAVRRLAIVCFKNGTPARETIVILDGIAADDETDRRGEEDGPVGRRCCS